MMERPRISPLAAATAVVMAISGTAVAQIAFNESVSRSYTVINEPTIVPTQTVSRAITVLNLPTVEPREAVGKMFTVLNSPTVESREAVSKMFTILNAPTISPRESVGRTFTLCNRSVNIDTDSDGVHDCDDACFGFPDNVDADSDGIPDGCDQCPGFDDLLDCNLNSRPDHCDITSGASTDLNSNDIPDECEGDCNSNGVGDPLDIRFGASEDCNSSGIPDECELAAGTTPDSDGDGVIDPCDACPGFDDSLDCNTNGVPDGCDVGGASADCDANGIPDECEPDCNHNGAADACDITGLTSEDCDGDQIPDECQSAAPSAQWAGPSGAAWASPANWLPNGVPSGGQQAILANSSPVANRCILAVPGQTGVCELTVGASGSGRQILQIDAGSTLHVGLGTSLQPGGDIELHGGVLSGGPLTNTSNSLRGYGRLMADAMNHGLIEARPGDSNVLRLMGAGTANQPTGTLRATAGTAFLIQSAGVTQAGDIEVRPVAIVSFDAPLINAAGGLISLLGGSIGASGITNAAMANIVGTGTIDSNVLNDGLITTIANMLIVGNLQNEGVVIILGGILTLTGNLSGNGQIIGSFGGRGGACGLTLQGDFDMTPADPAAVDFTTAVLRMNGSPRRGSQRFRLLAADQGPAVTLPGDRLGSIGELCIGPNPTTVMLVGPTANSRVAERRALYVGRLTLESGVTLDLAGQTVYYAAVVAAADARVIDSVGGGSLRPLETGAGRKKD